jgi:hypothetical protein
MARTTGEIERDYTDELPEARDEDLSRVKQMMGGMGEQPRRKLPMPPNPTDPRLIGNFEQFKKLLPEVEKNSSSAAEYSENIRRVLNALFKLQYKSEPDDADRAEIEKMVQFHTDMYAIKHRSLNMEAEQHSGEEDVAFEPNPMQQQRRNELEQYQQDFQDRQK